MQLVNQNRRHTYYSLHIAFLCSRQFCLQPMAAKIHSCWIIMANILNRAYLHTKASQSMTTIVEWFKDLPGVAHPYCLRRNKHRILQHTIMLVHATRTYQTTVRTTNLVAQVHPSCRLLFNYVRILLVLLSNFRTTGMDQISYFEGQVHYINIKMS